MVLDKFKKTGTITLEDINTMALVGRVGLFSSNTTNTLLENLLSCSMKIVEHDLRLCLIINSKNFF